MSQPREGRQNIQKCMLSILSIDKDSNPEEDHRGSPLDSPLDIFGRLRECPRYPSIFLRRRQPFSATNSPSSRASNPSGFPLT